MDSCDFYTHMVDLEDLHNGVADEHLDPFNASSDVQNLYVPDINQGLPFQTGYCTSSSEPFLVESGVYPSSICLPWFDGTESCEAIERFPNRKLAACHGRNFGNTMMLPASSALNSAPSKVPNIAPSRGPRSMNALIVALRGNELPGVARINTNIKETDGRMRNSQKRHWTKEETQKLRELVEKFGTKNWTQIAENIPGRVGKQCRDRWYNHARPDIKKDKLTDEEEWRLVEALDKIGPRWSQLAKIIPRRAENSLKNHWHSNLRKFKNGSNRISSIMKDYIMSLPAENIGIEPSATTIENSNFQLGENFDHRVGYAIENNFQLGENYNHQEGYAIENKFQLGDTSELKERYMNERDGPIWNEQQVEMPEFQNLNPSGTDSELPEKYAVREEQYNMEFTATSEDNVNSECETLIPCGTDSEEGKLIPEESTGERCSAWFDGTWDKIF